MHDQGVGRGCMTTGAKMTGRPRDEQWEVEEGTEEGDRNRDLGKSKDGRGGGGRALGNTVK